MESWYSFPLGAWRFTTDCQFAVNPAFNRDCGPVSIFGARLRTQF
jgi:high affinity Mn2+ porin